jgi:CDP-6-deoxy-D-xylo-4-hexulose-3-dehydrase
MFADLESALLQERELRQQAIDAAIRYYEYRHKPQKTFRPGDRIPYAGRVFDEREISYLVDSALDFWLTAGRYAERFEKDFADFLGVQHC